MKISGNESQDREIIDGFESWNNVDILNFETLHFVKSLLRTKLRI